MKVLFVTGTSTEVGKTYFCKLLLKKLRKNGKKTFYFKPVETGGEIAEDWSSCSALSDFSEPPVYHFKYPVSPHYAAKLEKKKIDIRKIKNKISALMKSNADFIILEGAGGILVPLKENPLYTYRELIADMGCPAIIVASSYLGVINHTLLTLEVAKAKKIKVIGVALNFPYPPKSIAEKTNELNLKKILGNMFLGKINYGQKELPDSIYKKIMNKI